MLSGAPAWRPPMYSWLVFALILVIAAGLRFASIASGVPAALAPGEASLMEQAFGMLTSGRYQPAGFAEPALYTYAQTGLAAARFLAGSVRGEWFSLEAVSAADFYVWGRSLTALLGTLTVVLVWRIGHRVSAATGLVAAALLALQPPHVIQSHYVLIGVPVAFLTTLALFCAVRAHETARVSLFLLAGAASGLAAATSYAGAMAIVFPIVALALTPAMRTAAAFVAVAGGALAAFVIAAPYSVLDLPGFLNGIGDLARQRDVASGGAMLPWTARLFEASLAMGIAPAALALAGLVAGAGLAFRTSGAARVVWVSAAAFVAVAIAGQPASTPAGGRDLILVLPALMLLAGGAFDFVMRGLPAAHRPRLAAVVALTVILLGPSAWRTTRALEDLSRTPTTQLAHEPRRTSVVVEGDPLNLPVRFRTQQVASLVDYTYDDYLRDGAVLVVASSRAPRGAMFGGSEAESQRYRNLFRQMQLVFAAMPSRDHPGPAIHIYRLVRPRP